MNSNYSLIFLLFFFISCYSTDRESNEEKEAIHNQLSSNVEITLTEMGNIKALVTAELLEKNDEMTDWFIDAGYDLSDLEICPNVEEVKKKMLECKIF